MKVKVNFYGHLIGKIGKNSIVLNAESVRDVISQISKKYNRLKAPLNIGRYRIKIDEIDCLEDINRPLEVSELNIRPIVKFSGGDTLGVFQVVVGAVLIIGGALTANPSMVMTGVAMLTSGIMSLMYEAPSTENTDNPEGSKYVGSPANTTEIGTRISLGYGLYKVSGHYLSFDVNAKDVIIT